MVCAMRSPTHALLALVLAATLAAADPADDLAAVRAQGIYEPPFRTGTWFVAQGGDTPNVNLHLAVPNQSYAIDIAATAERRFTRGEGRDLADYVAFGMEVVAPCAGTVLEAVDTFPDNPIGTQDKVHVFGNHVIIDAGHGEYVVLAHLQLGSLRVKAGDRLAVGDLIGLVGNSGNSTQPHIHMQVQDQPALGAGLGHLFTFVHVRAVIAGTTLENREVPLLRGMWLSRPD
jgi:murein DD-endopeptidase MepM/ murein hydrolase activator NlpD